MAQMDYGWVSPWGERWSPGASWGWGNTTYLAPGGSGQANSYGPGGGGGGGFGVDWWDEYDPNSPGLSWSLGKGWAMDNEQSPTMWSPQTGWIMSGQSTGRFGPGAALPDASGHYIEALDPTAPTTYDALGARTGGFDPDAYAVALYGAIGLGRNAVFPRSKESLGKYLGMSGNVPTYFNQQPQQYSALSPMAQQWLGRLFDAKMQSPEVTDIYGETSGSTQRPGGDAGQSVRGITGTYPYILPWNIKQYRTSGEGVEGIPAGTEIGGTPGTEEVGRYAITAAIPFSNLPSAQTWRQLEAEGAMPILKDYTQNILGQDFGQTESRAKSLWPEAKQRQPSWRPARQ